MNFFQRLKEGLSKTRGNFTARVDELVDHTQVIDEEFYDELTDILILSDAGVTAAERII
ncbi:MAG: signal recognition particle-docking protein FtsY, partial [Clostridia bacterium]|nr:signal recognition particle-docking protein FtsY [Clostridia bacterium]